MIAQGRLSRFARFCWGVLAYNVLVVLWGAFVRATGSGAGCGRHWPRCDGVVIPRLESTEQIIEFTHRATSGVALLLVLAMLVWAFRAFPAQSTVRRGAVASTVLIVIEALLGAGLVLLELVADNPSGVRAFSMAAHLVNTFLLLGALTLTAWWASGGRPLRLRGQSAAGWLVGGGVAALLLVGATGAIAALGDTLFPAQSLAAGFRQDTDPAAHFLLRLRALHPLVAVLAGAYIVFMANVLRRLRPSPATRRMAVVLTGLYAAQIMAGIVNLVLLVPVEMQILHLLMADLVWIALVITGASALAESSAHRAPAVSPAPPERSAALT